MAFDGSKFETEPRSALGKSLAWLDDDRLKSYEWVVPIDMDVFWCRPEGVSGTMPFFLNLMQSPKELGLIESLRAEQWPVFKTQFPNHIMPINTKLSKDKIIIPFWLDRLRKLITKEAVDRYINGGGYLLTLGCIYFIPFRRYCKEFPEIIDWMIRASIAFQDDEAVLSVYESRFGDQRPIWHYLEGYKESQQWIASRYNIDFINQCDDELIEVSDNNIYLYHASNKCSDQIYKDMRRKAA